MNYKTDTTKGLYTLINPTKYISTKRPLYKSKWEWRVFDKLDNTATVLQWGYECIEIYYYNPLQRRYSVYYPDIFFVVLDASGNVQNLLMEIKPAKMTVPPDPPSIPKSKTAQSGIRYKKALERYHNAQMDFLVNKSKWEAATKWCITHNVKFGLVTENNVGAVLGL